MPAESTGDFQMYFLTFTPDGEYCFQVAKMVTPCRYRIDEVDFLVRLHNPDEAAVVLLFEAAARFIEDATRNP